MRKSIRDAISDLQSALALRIEATERVLLQRIHEADEGTITAIDKIQPASVDLTQEMADDIVRKIHGPLTISKEFSRWIAEQGKFSDFYYQFPIGYGSDAGRGNLRMRGDGSLHLQLEDRNGAYLWRGTFVPPDFGREP